MEAENYKFHGMIMGAKMVLILAFLVCGCANQQPPGGGEEDKSPPKVKIISPKQNATNFRGNTIAFEFSEYVDRRSFQDAFRISPRIEGDIEYNWGGKDVEVSFPQNLEKLDANKTFVVNISTSLKDIHGNAIAEAISLAFSTGTKIDKAEIHGKAFNNNEKVTAVLAYNIESTSGFDPTKNLPDYLTESGSAGDFVLTNLAPGNYRLLAIVDDDRNLLFTSERESYGVLPYDVLVTDSAVISNINFYMKEITQTGTTGPELDYTKYSKDSLGIVYTSIESDSRVVLPEQSIFIFFNRYKPTRDELVNSLKITDEAGSTERVVFNWRNDSLVEVFPQGKFASNRSYALSFDLKTVKDSVYRFTLPFRTVSANSFGELKGTVYSFYNDYPLVDYPVRIELVAPAMIPLLKYSYEVRDTVFAFKNILEAEYSLFSYVDININSAYDYGYPFPFEHSEPFFIYPQKLNIRGGWTVENVKVSFVK